MTDRVVAEGRETNNIAGRDFTLLLPPLPDLRIVGIEAPAEGLAGTAIPIAWRTTNQGPASATAPWMERVRLTPNAGSAPSRNLLFNEVTNDLPASAAAPRSRLVSLPAGLSAGNYTLEITADSEGSVYEGTENNNATTAPGTLTVPGVLEWQVPVTEIAENAVQPVIPALLHRNGDLTLPLVVSLERETTSGKVRSPFRRCSIGMAT